MRDPRRLSEDPRAGELTRALREAGELGSRERVASAWQRIEPVLDRVPPAAIDASSGLSALTKGALLAGTLALGTVGWLVLAPATTAFEPARSSAAEPNPTPIAATTPSAVATSPAPNSGAANTVVPSPALVAEPEPSPATAAVATRLQKRPPATQRAKSALAAVQPAAAPAPALPDADGELALLTRAQEQLEVAPATALALLGEHEQRYASGVLVQERELLRIDAERALGRSDSAAARAQAFIARFPRSPQRARLETWLSTRSQRDVPAAEADKP
jgi:hypothetical protein